MKRRVAVVEIFMPRDG